jgi:hypothetical protein
MQAFYELNWRRMNSWATDRYVRDEEKPAEPHEREERG